MQATSPTPSPGTKYVSGPVSLMDAIPPTFGTVCCDPVSLKDAHHMPIIAPVSLRDAHLMPVIEPVSLIDACSRRMPLASSSHVRTTYPTSVPEAFRPGTTIIRRGPFLVPVPPAPNIRTWKK